MKIERINLYFIRMPLQTPFETSFGRITTRDCILLEAFAEGLIGYGECVADADPGYSYETSGTAWMMLQEFLLPAVLGKDLSGPQGLLDRLSFVRGHLMAKAGLEMVLWDLHGKAQGRSLQALLGGVRPTVDVGVSVGIQESPELLLKVVAGYLEQGYRRVKLKIKPGHDLVETRAVRQAYPTLRLQVDANSAYTLETGKILTGLDDLDLLLIEQPLDEDDLWDHHYLQAELRTPICLDESVLSLRHARQALEMGSCRVINIKAGRVGGLEAGQQIHDLCLSKNIPVWCGGMLETNVGRAANLALASLPGFILPGDISATERYYAEDITEENFILNPDSTITVPTDPGLGIHLHRPSVERFTLRQASLKA